VTETIQKTMGQNLVTGIGFLPPQDLVHSLGEFAELVAGWQSVINRTGKDGVAVMPGEEIYELYIDSFTPETIPMARLADYTASFAELLGHREHVHFGRLETGKFEGLLPVWTNRSAQSRQNGSMRSAMGGGPQPARKALTEIDDKLAEDNAVGRILPRYGKADRVPR